MPLETEDMHMINSRQGTRGDRHSNLPFPHILGAPTDRDIRDWPEIIRALQISEVCRDAGHMFAYAMDFAQTRTRTWYCERPKGFGILRAPAALGHNSFQADVYRRHGMHRRWPDADTVGCPNIFKTVFVRDAL